MFKVISSIHNLSTIEEYSEWRNDILSQQPRSSSLDRRLFLSAGSSLILASGADLIAANTLGRQYGSAKAWAAQAASLLNVVLFGIQVAREAWALSEDIAGRIKGENETPTSQEGLIESRIISAAGHFEGGAIIEYQVPPFDPFTSDALNFGRATNGGSKMVEVRSRNSVIGTKVVVG